jgi:8-oxo-dGTP pyrophosphatase MutT (NUDIX family)
MGGPNGGAVDGAGPGTGRWVRLTHRELFRSEWFEVYRDDVIRPDGSRGEYDHVVAPGSVTVLAMDESRKVVVTRQWIYVHGSMQWRLPSGRIDDSDFDAEAAARRELLEETGITAGCWTKIGVLHGADSFTNHREHVFVATDLQLAPVQKLESGEADLSVHWLSVEHTLDLVRSGEMPHAGSAFAVLLAGTLVRPIV